MKKTLFVLLALTSGFLAFSQNPAPNKEVKKEKIKALYVAFITKELNLNEEEAQKFWPVHSQYDAAFRAVNEKKLPELDREQEALNVRKTYKDKFDKILGKERTEVFYKKDKEFKAKMIERLKKNKAENNGNPSRKKDNH